MYKLVYDLLLVIHTWGVNSLGGLLFAALYVVFLSEPLYPSSSVNELLLSGKEWVAGRTYFNMGQINGRLRFNFISTCTGYDNRLVVRMYILFHGILHTGHSRSNIQ